MSIRSSKKQNRTLFPVVALLMSSIVMTSCANTGGPAVPRRQITECPPGMVLICTSRQPASKGGDEEIPQYEHCYCRSII